MKEQFLRKYKNIPKDSKHTGFADWKIQPMFVCLCLKLKRGFGGCYLKLWKVKHHYFQCLRQICVWEMWILLEYNHPWSLGRFSGGQVNQLLGVVDWGIQKIGRGGSHHCLPLLLILCPFSQFNVLFYRLFCLLSVSEKRARAVVSSTFCNHAMPQLQTSNCWLAGRGEWAGGCNPVLIIALLGLLFY